MSKLIKYTLPFVLWIAYYVVAVLAANLWNKGTEWPAILIIIWSLMMIGHRQAKELGY